MGTGQVLARQQGAGQDSGQVWNRTELFFGPEPGLLAGCPDPLLSLVRAHSARMLLRSALPQGQSLNL